jgi:hypothetical protein
LSPFSWLFLSRWPQLQVVSLKFPGAEDTLSAEHQSAMRLEDDFSGAEDMLSAEHQSAMRLEDDFSAGREEVSRAVGTVAAEIGTMDFGTIIIFSQVGGDQVGGDQVGGEGDGDGMDTHIILTATDTTITATQVIIPMVQGTATIPANRNRWQRTSKPSCEGKDIIGAVSTELLGPQREGPSDLSRRIAGYRPPDGLTEPFCMQCVLHKFKKVLH